MRWGFIDAGVEARFSSFAPRLNAQFSSCIAGSRVYLILPSSVTVMALREATP